MTSATGGRDAQITGAWDQKEALPASNAELTSMGGAYGGNVHQFGSASTWVDTQTNDIN
jgi:hypothetical protein